MANKISILVALMVIVIALTAECNGDEGKESLQKCSGAVLAKDTLVGDCYNKFKGLCCDDKFPSVAGSERMYIIDDWASKMLHDIDCNYCYSSHTAAI